jgi:hypothetical protein
VSLLAHEVITRAMDGASNGAREGSHNMRQQYTCIFARTIRSHIWAMPTSWRCVWLWLKLSADPEGFVCASSAGVAIGANVSLEEARDALLAL